MPLLLQQYLPTSGLLVLLWMLLLLPLPTSILLLLGTDAARSGGGNQP
jgi:hypothetical protein